MIQRSEQMKSAAEAKASNLADKLVPYTFVGSLVSLALTRNLTRALSVLMVDFSCALKLAMPLAVLSAMREAGREHITVKGGKFLEAVASADTIVFDKTGTLTHACPRVARVIPFNGMEEAEMLRLAACLEEHFPHSNLAHRIQRTLALLCELFNSLCLRKGRRCLSIIHCRKEILLFFSCQIGKLHRRIEFDLTRIHHIQQFRNQFGKTDIAVYLISAFSCLLTDYIHCLQLHPNLG